MVEVVFLRSIQLPLRRPCLHRFGFETLFLCLHWTATMIDHSILSSSPDSSTQPPGSTVPWMSAAGCPKFWMRRQSETLIAESCELTYLSKQREWFALHEPGWCALVEPSSWGRDSTFPTLAFPQRVGEGAKRSTTGANALLFGPCGRISWISPLRPLKIHCFSFPLPRRTGGADGRAKGWPQQPGWFHCMIKWSVWAWRYVFHRKYRDSDVLDWGTRRDEAIRWTRWGNILFLLFQGLEINKMGVCGWGLQQSSH